MADFHQNGVISTLHNFSHRSIEDIENELRIFAKDDPIELILPSLYSEDTTAIDLSSGPDGVNTSDPALAISLDSIS